MVTRAAERADQFVQLQVNRFCVPVLRVLNQKDHEKGHNGCAGVNDELPGIRIMEGRSCQRPDDDDAKGNNESPGAAQNQRSRPGKEPEQVPHPANKTGRFHFFAVGPGGDHFAVNSRRT